jgi:hypothetical protein
MLNCSVDSMPLLSWSGRGKIKFCYRHFVTKSHKTDSKLYSVGLRIVNGNIVDQLHQKHKVAFESWQDYQWPQWEQDVLSLVFNREEEMVEEISHSASSPIASKQQLPWKLCWQTSVDLMLQKKHCFVVRILTDSVIWNNVKSRVASRGWQEVL